MTKQLLTQPATKIEANQEPKWARAVKVVLSNEDQKFNTVQASPNHIAMVSVSKACILKSRQVLYLAKIAKTHNLSYAFTVVNGRLFVIVNENKS